MIVLFNGKKPLVVHAIANFMTGGSTQLVVDIINHTGDLYDHEVVTSYNPTPPAHNGVTIHEYSHSCSLKSIVEFLRKTKPVFVHIHYWGECDLPWYEKIFKAAEQLGCRVLENINTPVAPYMSKAVSCYIYVSQYVYDTFGDNAEKSIVIYPGSNFSFLKRKPNSEIADDCIGMVYRLETDKLNLQSIDVFIKVAQRRPQTRVLIVGGGTYLEPYQKAVKDARVEKSFIFTGYVPYEELPNLYQQMSLFVAPVWKESFGQVSPFAMNFGLPVVGYNIGALEEILGNRDLLAEPGDSDQLADIIVELLNDKEKRHLIGRENMKRANEYFSIESMIDSYRSIYSQTIEEIPTKNFENNKIFETLAKKKVEQTRIALFVHCFFPDHFYGTETYTLTLAKNLQSLGYEPIIISAKFPGEPQEDNFLSYYEYEGLPVYCIDKNYCPHTRVKDTYYHEEMRAVLKSVLVKIQPDIVHVTHFINHTGVLLEVCEELEIPSVATMTDFYGHCFNNKLQRTDGSLCFGPSSDRTECLACFHGSRVQSGNAMYFERVIAKYPWLAKVERFIGMRSLFKGTAMAGLVHDIVSRPDILDSCYKRLKAAIVATRFTQKMYLNNGLTVPTYLLNFGVDLASRPKCQRAEGSPIKFGFIGQIAYHKGTDILVEAFKRILIGQAELYIYGSENQEPEYCKSLKEKVEGFPVTFRGTFPQNLLPDVLAELDFLVIPSRWYENSPLILLAALASHTPVIVSNVEGMTEFVTEGENGFIFELGDDQDLERVLKNIIENPGNSLDMVKNTQYLRDSKIMTEETIRVYEEVCGIIQSKDY